MLVVTKTRHLRSTALPFFATIVIQSKTENNDHHLQLGIAALTWYLFGLSHRQKNGKQAFQRHQLHDVRITWILELKLSSNNFQLASVEETKEKVGGGASWASLASARLPSDCHFLFAHSATTRARSKFKQDGQADSSTLTCHTTQIRWNKSNTNPYLLVNRMKTLYRRYVEDKPAGDAPPTPHRSGGWWWCAASL